MYNVEHRTSDVKLYDITASVVYHQNLFSIAGDFNFRKYDGEASYFITSNYGGQKYEEDILTTLLATFGLFF